jgi:hypothetical protein
MDQETGSRNKEGGAVSKVESARVVLAPKWSGALRGGSGLSNPFAYC